MPAINLLAKRSMPYLFVRQVAEIPKDASGRIRNPRFQRIVFGASLMVISMSETSRSKPSPHPRSTALFLHILRQKRSPSTSSAEQQGEFPSRPQKQPTHRSNTLRSPAKT